MGRADLSFYGDYASALDEAMALLEDTVVAEIAAASASETTAFEHVKSRIKTPDSATAKLLARGFEPSAASAIENLSDLIGIRIITRFIGDIYTISEILHASPNIGIIEMEDYIAAPKPSGYRSLHLVTEAPFVESESGCIRAEIQLRTIAMDCWASLEHQLKYKKKVANAALVAEELRRCADEIASTDISMQTIKDILERDCR